MACRCFVVSFLFTLTLTQIFGQTLYGLKGHQVNLKPDIKQNTGDFQILWKHNGNKVVEFDTKQQQVYGMFKDRVILDWFSAELTIKDLRDDDSGEYELEVYKTVLDQSKLYLKVIDKVASPTISCEMKEGSSSNTEGIRATLMCSAEPGQTQSLLEYHWISHGNSAGPNLTITVKDRNDHEVYSCKLSNPLSAETTNFTAKDCYSDTSYLVPLIAGVICSVFILILIVIVIFVCKRKVCCAKENDVENQRTHDKDLTPLLHSTVPSPQNPDDSDGNHINSQNHPDEMPAEGFVKNRVKKIEESINDQTLPNTPTDKGDAAHLKEPDSSDVEEETEPDPACVEDVSEDKLSDVLFSPAAEQPAHLKEPDSSDVEEETKSDPACVEDVSEDKLSDVLFSPAAEQPESEKSSDEEEEAKSPASDTSPPIPKPRSHMPKEIPNLVMMDTTDGHRNDDDSLTGETVEENVSESDSSVIDSDPGDSAISQQEGSETTDSNLPQGGSHTKEPGHQETDMLVSPDDGNESNNKEDKANNFPFQQPQTPTNPDDNKTDTSEELPATAHAEQDPEEEGEITHDSHEDDGESNGSTAKADQGEAKATEQEDQCVSNKKQPGNDSEETEVHKEGKDVE